MNWTKTLQVAQMLTEAIQANVPPEHPTQETPMGDDTLINQDPTQAAPAPVAADPTAPAAVVPTVEAVPAPAPVPEAAPDAVAQVTALSAALGSAAPGDINATLQNAAHLANALHQNPEVLKFMIAFLGKFGASLEKDI